MLDDNTKGQLATYFERISQPVELIASLDDSAGATDIRELVTEITAIAPDKISGTFKAGISQEQAKKLGKLIRDEGPKSVKTQVMGDELRVTSKSRDDLQEVIALVKGADLDFAVQFDNYR